MIQTAIELSGGRITGAEIRKIIDFGKQMLQAPIEPLDHVSETLKTKEEFQGYQFYEVEHIGQIPQLVERLASSPELPRP